MLCGALYCALHVKCEQAINQCAARCTNWVWIGCHGLFIESDFVLLLDIDINLVIFQSKHALPQNPTFLVTWPVHANDILIFLVGILRPLLDPGATFTPE